MIFALGRCANSGQDAAFGFELETLCTKTFKFSFPALACRVLDPFALLAKLSIYLNSGMSETYVDVDLQRDVAYPVGSFGHRLPAVASPATLGVASEDLANNDPRAGVSNDE